MVALFDELERATNVLVNERLDILKELCERGAHTGVPCRYISIVATVAVVGEGSC